MQIGAEIAAAEKAYVNVTHIPDMLLDVDISYLDLVPACLCDEFETNTNASVLSPFSSNIYCTVSFFEKAKSGYARNMGALLNKNSDAKLNNIWTPSDFSFISLYRSASSSVTGKNSVDAMTQKSAIADIILFSTVNLPNVFGTKLF